MVIKQILKPTPTNKLLWSSRVALKNIDICTDRTLPSGRSLVTPNILSSQHSITTDFCEVIHQLKSDLST